MPKNEIELNARYDFTPLIYDNAPSHRPITLATEVILCYQSCIQGDLFAKRYCIRCTVQNHVAALSQPPSRSPNSLVALRRCYF